MFGYVRDYEPGGGGFFTSTPTAWNQKLGINGVSSQFDQGIPFLSFTQSGMTTPLNFGLDHSLSQTYNIQDNLTWVRGRHSIQTGFELFRNSSGSDIISTNSTTCVYGCINFSGRWTGFDFADLMLGLPFSSSLQIPAQPDSTGRNQWGAYIQDDFKATSKLNVTFGLRYNYFPTVRSAHDYEAIFDPVKNQLIVPSQKALSEIPVGITLPMPVVTASQAGYPSSLLQANKNDWQPRVGLAYRFMNNSVVRAGGGVYRTPLVSTGNRLVTGPYQITENFPNAQPDPNGPPVLSLANPYQIAGTVKPPLLSFFAPDKDVKDLLNYDYNLTVEHQFRSTAFAAEYEGKRTILPWAPNLNAVPASLTPFSQSRLPFPALGSITGLENGAHYNYDALRLNASRRFTGGLYFDATYIWSKTIDDLAGIAAETAGSSENPFNRARDRGVSFFMPPTRMVINYVWEAPFGKLGGRLSFSDHDGAGRMLNTVIKDWVTAGTYNLQSSPPLTPSGSYRNAAGQIYDAPNTNHFSGRPECTGQSFQPTSAQRAQGYIFNPNAFSELVPQGQYGSCGPTLLEFGPNSYGFNQSIFRTFKIPWFTGNEGAKFRFGFLMFNAINHSNGTSPVTNLDSPLFGKLTNPKAGNVRSMYLQGRIDF
jgi:TonB dependent receptor